jgi:tetratricopeptide (TPR) repeat protein
LTNNYDREEASDAFRVALLLRPNLVRTWVNQGFAFSNSQNFEGSIHNYLNALALNPKAGHIWEYLLSACRNSGRTDLVEKVRNKDLSSFRAEFTFLDPNNMPKPDMEALFSHPIMNEPSLTGDIWDNIP